MPEAEIRNEVLSSTNDHLFFSEKYKIARPIIATNEVLNLPIHPSHKESILLHERIHFMLFEATQVKRKLLIQEMNKVFE